MQARPNSARSPGALAASPANTSRELLALHRALYRRQQALINRSVAGLSKSFKLYEARYRRGVKTFEAVVPYARVASAATAADLVYVGDYHTLRQAQKSYLRLVRSALESGRRVVLALEFVQGKHQEHVDAYLAGRITEAQLLTRIDYQRHQVFDVWPNFRPIFELARDAKLPIVAIDKVASGPSSLVQRDAYAAARIARAAVTEDRPLVLVLVGQLHIAPAHLPASVDRALEEIGAESRRPLVVHQNCEDIYWKLAETGLDRTTEAVRVREGEYCLVNTSPTVCQQSFLDCLEPDDETGFDELGPAQAFRDMAKLVASFLELSSPALSRALDEVQVFSCGDLSFLRELKGTGAFTPRELATLKRQVLSRESCYVPRARLAYLATLSMNHAGEEATHFLRHAVAGAAMDKERPPVDAFYARIVEEALGFFGSKIVNPRRRCSHDAQLSALLAGPENAERNAAALALVHRRFEAEGKLEEATALATMLDGATFNAVTHLLGYMLGDRLYAGMHAGRIEKAEIRRLFHERLENEGEAFALYAELSKRLRKVKLPDVH